MPTDVNKVLKTKSLAAFTLIYILIVYVIIVNKKTYKWPLYILKPGLIYILKYGVTDRNHLWCNNYLSNRKQFIQINEEEIQN